MKCDCWEVAHHEAGHAVADIVLGHGITYATLRPSAAQWNKDGSMTRTRAHVMSTTAGASADTRAISALAGPIAESIRMGRWDRWIGAEGDFAQAAAMILKMAGLLAVENEPIWPMYMATGEYMEQHSSAWRRAYDIVAEHWEDVRAVAEHLLDNEESSGPTIARIVEEHRTPSPYRWRARWGACEACRKQALRQRRTRKQIDPSIEQLTMF